LVIKHLLNIRLAWNQESFPKLSLREGDMAEKKRSSAQILTSKQTGLYCKSAKYIIFSDYVTECRVVENQDDLTSWQVCRLVLVLILQCHCFTFLKSKHTASVCSTDLQMVTIGWTICQHTIHKHIYCRRGA